MNENQCEYCLKIYKKNGLKPHYKRCKIKIEHHKNEILKITSLKKFDEFENNIINLFFFDNISNDLIIFIINYLINGKKDTYCSYRRFYNEYLDICYISKKFYNLFYPCYEKILIMKNNIQNEKLNRICKTSAKSEYKLTDYELDENIDFFMVKNPYYRCARPMKIYQIADILDYMYNKYKFKKNHDKYLEIIKSKKIVLLEKKKLNKENRKDNINNLIEKYNITENDEVYNEYYNNYINKGIPSLKKIEENIILFIEMKKRKNLIEDNLIKHNMQDFFNHNIVTNYIKNNNNNIDNIILLLDEIKKRKILIYEELKEYNNILHYNNDIINKYIEKNIGKIDIIINYFEEINIRKNNILENIKFKNKKILTNNNVIDYIKNNNYTLEYIINYLNKEICECNNKPSHLCGYCKNCCKNENCKKHNKN